MYLLLTDTHLSEDNLLLNKSIFHQAIDICKERKIQKIIHLGDVFDSRKAQPQGNLIGVEQILEDLQAENITMYCIPGNHDKSDYDSEYSYLTPYKHFPSLKLFEDYQFFKAYDSIYYHFIPYFRENKSYLPFLEQAFENIEKIGKDSIVHYLFTHIGLNQYWNNDKEQVKGSLSIHDFKIFDKVFIGHYHDRNFPYIGSAFQHNYGEEPENKGFIILHERGEMELIPTEYPRYYTVKFDLNKEVNLDLERWKEKKEEGDFVKFQFTGPLEKVRTINKELIEGMGIKIEAKLDSNTITLTPDSISFNQNDLKNHFENFCKENNFNLETGLKYLNEKLKS